MNNFCNLFSQNWFNLFFFLLFIVFIVVLQKWLVNPFPFLIGRHQSCNFSFNYLHILLYRVSVQTFTSLPLLFVSTDRCVFSFVFVVNPFHILQDSDILLIPTMCVLLGYSRIIITVFSVVIKFYSSGFFSLVSVDRFVTYANLFFFAFTAPLS